jgi:hypothetical protein
MKYDTAFFKKVGSAQKIICSNLKSQRYSDQELIRYTYPFISESN